MIASVTFKNDVRGVFCKGERLEIRPYTLLVGDQGCGKSTLLQAIIGYTRRSEEERKESSITIESKGPRLGVAALDFEKDNPRTQGRRLRDDMDTMGQIASRFASHGEVVVGLLETMPEKAVLLMDEPDVSLSPRSVYWLSRELRKRAAAGSQIIVAVHSPILIEEAGEVLSLEHKRWMPGSEFLELHRTEPKPEP